MNVTASEFKAYLEEFHSTLDRTATQYLPPDLARSLLHLSTGPRKIQGYVSTQFGVAFEYIPSGAGVDVLVGSRRIEGLFLSFPSQLERRLRRRRAEIVLGQGSVRNTFVGCKVVGDAAPFYIEDVDSDATFVRCHFEAPGWSRDVEYAEIFGNRSSSFWSVKLAVGRAKDEVLSALVELKKAEQYKVPIHEYVNTLKRKTILILGDYSDTGLKRLEVIRTCAMDLGYAPLLVKDVPDLFGTDLQQKVAILGALARFVLVDDTSPSGHLIELPIAQHNRWVTVLLHAHGQRSTVMTAGLNITSGVLGEQDFDPAAPRAGVARAVEWAESQLRGVETQYKGLYPWRERNVPDARR
jgi:hypothetical protein